MSNSNTNNPSSDCPESTGILSSLVGVRIFNVRDFGAKGDGTTLDTVAVQATIDACASNHGGVVLIPPGVFVIGSTELKSNVTLHLAAQGTLLGSGNGNHYRAAEGIPLEGDTTLDDGNVGLLYAVHAENITIEGMGTIDGQGGQFQSPAGDQMPPAGIRGPQRPHPLLFHRCRNLVIRNIFIKDGAFHAIRIIQSEYVKVDGIRIHNRIVFNGDGFHFVSCQHVHVTRCDINCVDDACAMFGTCRFVTVSDCVFTTRWSVFRFGGGDPENIVVSNCLIHTTFGCPIKMQFERTSRAQNMMFSNLILKDVTGPITINRSPASGPEGFVRNIRFSNIHATVVTCGWQMADVPWPENYRSGETRQCIVLNGVDGLVIESISFSDIHVVYAGGGTLEEAKRTVPQVGGEYFEIGTPPAYGLYARNVRGLTINNVRFEVVQPDARPAVVFDHVRDVYACGLSTHGNPEAEAVLRFIDSSEMLITAPRVLTPAGIFLQVEGASTAAITIDGGEVSKAVSAVVARHGAKDLEVKIQPR